MSKFLHGAFHVLMIGVQVANIASNVIPAPYNMIVAGVVGIVQGAVALKNHKGS